jgi:hypothetical protein
MSSSTRSSVPRWVLRFISLTSKRLPGQGSHPIYGISIPLERATAEPSSFPEYEALCAVAARYNLAPPAIHLCIYAESGIYYKDIPEVGEDDTVYDPSDEGTSLAAGLEHLRVRAP